MATMGFEMNDVELFQLLSDIESYRVERTISIDNTDKFRQAICAFANDMPGSGKPGYLFIGVDDKGQPSGATIDDKLLVTLRSLKDDGNILPRPDSYVEKREFDGKSVAVVKVNPSDMPPVRYKGEVWIRTGPAKSRASVEQERRLEERRIDRAQTWDMRACRDATLDDLALDLFKLNYLPQSVAADVLRENGRTIEEQMSSLRLYHSKLKCPTNAAVVLFGKDVLAQYPGAYVQYVAYEGPSQASEVLREQRSTGDLLTVLRWLDEIAYRVAAARPVQANGLAEQTVYDYPPLALHELLINAVIHRNYEGSTTPISINHFSDRIEIQNPGSLFGDMAKDQLEAGGTAYRNPVLAEAAKVYGFANRFGRGIIRAKELLQHNGSPPLAYTVGDNHLVVVVRKRV
jgi:ATP-dependent DNA helicase RecG